MKILITGIAGFMGFHTAIHFSEMGFAVVGVDNLSPDGIAEKHTRLSKLPKSVDFHQIDIANKLEMGKILDAHSDLDVIIHLAGEHGSESSFSNPEPIINSNISAFQSLLDSIVNHAPQVHLILGGSSAIYGDGPHPTSLYGVSKVAMEMLGSIYSKKHDFPVTILRFHSVYGEYMREDTAIRSFVSSIANGTHAILYNHGDNVRDYIHVSDAVLAIECAIYRATIELQVICDIGTGQPTATYELIEMIERHMGKAQKWYDIQKDGEFTDSCAEVDEATEMLGFMSNIVLANGLANYIAWFLETDQLQIEDKSTTAE